MSTPINDGGSAFPNEPRKIQDGDRLYRYDGTPGMTLRDWFAGQALAGILVNSKASDPSKVPEMLNAVSGYSYLAADAMLAARASQGAKSP